MKVILLTVFFVSGLVAFKGNYPGLSDFNQVNEGYSAFGTLAALISTIFSYQGFINVNCVCLLKTSMIEFNDGC